MLWNVNISLWKLFPTHLALIVHMKGPTVGQYWIHI